MGAWLREPGKYSSTIHIGGVEEARVDYMSPDEFVLWLAKQGTEK
jgi:hypothetical protein